MVVTLLRPPHVSKGDQRKEKGKRHRKRHLKVTSMQMEVRALFGRNVWRSDITNKFRNRSIKSLRPLWGGSRRQWPFRFTHNTSVFLVLIFNLAWLYTAENWSSVFWKPCWEDATVAIQILCKNQTVDPATPNCDTRITSAVTVLKRNASVVLSNRLRREVNLGLIDGGSHWWRRSTGTLGVSAKESSHFHMHGNHFYVSLSVMFSFLLSLTAFCSHVVVAIA